MTRKIAATIRQHIQFAKFWYAANSCFTELKEHCASIAREAGLNLDPEDAWQLARHGWDLPPNPKSWPWPARLIRLATKKLIELFDPEKRKPSWLIDGYNLFKLDLRGAKTGRIGVLAQGRIHAMPCYVRNGRRLPVAGIYADMIGILRETSNLATIIQLIDKSCNHAVR